MKNILILLFLVTGNAFGQNRNYVQLDSLFSTNFARLNSQFPSEISNETNNLNLTAKDVNFISVLSQLSHIGPSHINYSGIYQLTRNEVKLWELWYSKNYCKLKYSNIIMALSLMEKQNTPNNIDNDKEIEFPTNDMKYIQDTILNRIDTIPCSIRH
jgi:hypothetical protein